ncbi:MAG TPA: hypothetical protein EYP85_12305 [Armatimonadetes bacterium]|nr:hypothetical protein [Armatimonadota bacterium]
MIRQVQIRNYKSLASVVVNLKRLTVLVGPNGAGKSNFVDALSFVADSLNHSVQMAFATRGGIAAVRRRSFARFTMPSLAFDVTLFRLSAFGNGRSRTPTRVEPYRATVAM